jgi:heme exporter protein B
MIAVIRKDLRLEWRTREVFTATLVFAALVLLTMNFSFEQGQRAVEDMAAGLLWVAFVFADLGFAASWLKGRRLPDALYLPPADPGAIFPGMSPRT